jgi:hypothetical protein
MEWHLVYQNFITLDAYEILKTQPIRTIEEDVVAWAYEKNGMYTVRSAYRLLKEEQSRCIWEKEGKGELAIYVW